MPAKNHRKAGRVGENKAGLRSGRGYKPKNADDGN